MVVHSTGAELRHDRLDRRRIAGPADPLQQRRAGAAQGTDQQAHGPRLASRERAGPAYRGAGRQGRQHAGDSAPFGRLLVPTGGQGDRGGQQAGVGVPAVGSAAQKDPRRRRVLHAGDIVLQRCEIDGRGKRGARLPQLREEAGKSRRRGTTRTTRSDERIDESRIPGNRQQQIGRGFPVVETALESEHRIGGGRRQPSGPRHQPLPPAVVDQRLRQHGAGQKKDVGKVPHSRTPGRFPAAGGAAGRRPVRNISAGTERGARDAKMPKSAAPARHVGASPCGSGQCPPGATASVRTHRSGARTAPIPSRPRFGSGSPGGNGNCRVVASGPALERLPARAGALDAPQPSDEHHLVPRPDFRGAAGAAPRYARATRTRTTASRNAVSSTHPRPQPPAPPR